MVRPVSSREGSSLPVAQELPISERPTLSSVPSAVPVVLPVEDPDPPKPNFHERVERLLDENLALMKERKQLLEIADQRADRARECLDHARLARGLIREYVDACEKAAQLARDALSEHACDELEVERKKADEAYAALVALVETPL